MKVLIFIALISAEALFVSWLFDVIQNKFFQKFNKNQEDEQSHFNG